MSSFYKPSSTCQIPNLAELYTKLFGTSTNRTFIEVGAYDGDSFSNTAFLADIGWRGFYIEPIQEFAGACANRHEQNDVSVICCAIGPENKKIEIFQGGTLTTPLKSQVEMYEQIQWAKGHHKGHSTMVPQYRLESVLNKCKIEPEFDLLVVDVEGYEAAVFDSFDLTVWKPKVMIVEIEDKHESFSEFPDFIEKCAALREKIKAAGYVEIYSDHINTVFVADDHPACHKVE